MRIFDDCFKNKFSYEEIKSSSKVSLLNSDDYYINIIIGFRNRAEFLIPLIEYFNAAIKTFEISTGKKVCLTFVEHDSNPKHEYILDNNVNYLWTQGNVVNQYSRSFAYNFGVKYGNNAKYYLLHDLDILVKQNFFLELVENLKDFKCLQPYGYRHVLYMSNSLTQQFLLGQVDINTLTIGSDDVSPPDIIGSKGGSIFIEKETFLEVGGFDPELFWGYAAEDQIFWDKVSTITPIGYSDRPSIDMFHMWHEPTHSTNPLLFLMENYMVEFRSMSSENKLKFLSLKKDFFNE